MIFGYHQLEFLHLLDKQRRDGKLSIKIVVIYILLAHTNLAKLFS